MSVVSRELHFTVLSPTHSRFCGGSYCVKGIVIISCLHLRAVDSLKSKLPQIRVTEQDKDQYCQFPLILWRVPLQSTAEQFDVHVCVWLRCTAVFCIIWSSLHAKGCVPKLFCITRFQPRGDESVNNRGQVIPCQDGMESPSQKELTETIIHRYFSLESARHPRGKKFDFLAWNILSLALEKV